MAVRLQLLGSPTLEHDGESFALPFERRSQLLVFLALKRSWVGRAELAAMLWPEQGNKLAFSNLRKTLFRIQSLPWAGQVEVQGGALRFDAQTDIAEFEMALRESRVGEAARLHRGVFLAGFEDDHSEAWSSWLNFERDRLRAGWRAAVLDHMAGDIDPAEGIELSAQLLEADPLDESAMHAHMSWLARSGQGSQARQAYREFMARLREDLGLDPAASLKALHDSLGAAPAPVASIPSMALPVADDGFVGRCVELRQIATLLARPECRLVTLIGPGGVGKTRLARHALREMEALHADGAAFVALEDASAEGEIADRIARELGVALQPRRDPFTQVIDSLREREVLLALDNFEHLVAHAPMLEKLLRECPRVRIIATSRVRLGLPMEQLLPLEGLPCPDFEDQDRFEAFDAVRLFVKAAQRVEPALVPEVEAASIVEICRQVEGLPLALELAAAWTRVLSCDAIATQLREGAQLLQAVDGSRPARHASMEVVFDQSWRLLTPVERDAVARLSIFHGGFSADAAKAVAGASLPVLGALVDKSLLRKEGARLHIHPLLQRLAASRLEGDLCDETARAHALYFHRLMAQVRRGVEDGNREALQAMDVECANCRSAWQWAFTHDMRELVARSMPTLLHFSDHRFRVAEGLSLLREATDSDAVRADPRLEALLFASAAHLEYRLDRYADAQAHATRALAGTDEGADGDTRLQCFKVLGACCLRLGRLDDAKRYFRQALRQAPASIDPHNAAAMLDNLALVEKSLGRYGDALRLSQQSLVQHRHLNDTAGEALCLNNLGDLYLIMGDLESARIQLREGLALCERHGLVNTHALILVNLSDLSLRAGDPEAAETLARRALEIAESTGQRAIASWLKLQTAELALRRGDLAGARLDLASALELAIAIGRPSLQFAGIACFADLLAAQGETQCARRLLEFSAAQPSISVPDRDNAQTRLKALPAADGKSAEWPGLEIEELVHRIVIEHNVAHAPLVALLRAVP